MSRVLRFFKFLGIAWLMGGFLACQQTDETATDGAFTHFYAASEVTEWRGFYLGHTLELRNAAASSLLVDLAAYIPRKGAPSPWAIGSLKPQEEEAAEVLVLLHADLYLEPSWPIIPYGQFSIHPLPSSHVACQIEDKWYIFEQQTGLERLLDQLANKQATSAKVPLALPPNYPLSIFAPSWKPGEVGEALATTAWCFVVDTLGERSVVSEALANRLASSELLDALALVPAEAAAFTLYPVAGQAVLQLSLFGGNLLATAADRSRPYPSPSKQYLNVGIWEEPQDRLGWGEDKIYLYAIIDGQLWQSDDLSRLQSLILRSVSQPLSFLDREDVQAILPALSEAVYISCFPHRISREEERQLLVYQQGEAAFARFLSASEADKLAWEIDFGALISYWQLSPYSGHWLAQSSGGQISVGKGDAFQKLGFFAPLLAGPFSVEKGALLWQTEEAVYRYAAGQLDSLLFATKLGGRCFRDPLREAFLCLLIGEEGQVRAIDSQLKPYPLWESSEDLVAALSTPAILQGASGEEQCFVFLGAEEQVFALDRRGQLLWKQKIAGLLAPEKSWLRAPNSTAPREELGSCVSQKDPNQALYYQQGVPNTFVALRVGSKQIALVNAAGSVEILSPGEATISELLVADTNGDGSAELLLRCGKQIAAFSLIKTSEKTQMERLWQGPLEASGGQLFREEAAKQWGVFYPEKSLAVFYQGKAEARRLFATHPPAYDLLDRRYLQLNGSLLSAKK